MAKLNDITNWLNDYLKISAIEDGCWNGLQIEGGAEVSKIALAVDAGHDTFHHTQDIGAQLLIVHHGHFWKNADPSYSGWRKERLAPLIDNDISLYASHLPLDRHPEVGHNAQILKMLGANIVDGFYESNGVNVGYIGKFAEPAKRESLVKTINQGLKTDSTVLPFGPDDIRTVAVCSGGGSYGGFFEALSKKVDLYISGDSVEIYQTAKDARMNVIFAGHYATETPGLIALAEILSKTHHVETVFIDMPTGL